MNVKPTNRSALLAAMLLSVPALSFVGIDTGRPTKQSAPPKPLRKQKNARPVRTQKPSRVSKVSKDQTERRQIGKRLLSRVHSGIITLVNPERDGVQIRSLAEQGCLCNADKKPVAISLALLHVLDRLSAHASPKKPLAVLSLYRPPATKSRHEPHGNGLAVDIAAYGGHTIHGRNPQSTVSGVLAIIQALEPGDYRLGLPKPPQTDPIAFLPPPRRPANWPFFPAPLPVATPVPGVNLPGLNLVLPKGSTLRGGVRPLIARWENERSAPLADVGNPRIRMAIQIARSHRVNIHMLFPDAVDHLHLDVVPASGFPESTTEECPPCGDK
jgi:hypothetical protein